MRLFPFKRGLITKKVIMGCEARGDADSPYLTRWTLLGTKRGSLYLHKFHRSDGPDQHCHPWPFWSVVLWPGYREVTPDGSQRRWPLIPAFRPATYRHRVQLFQTECRLCAGMGITHTGEDAHYYFDLCPKCVGAGRKERVCWTLIWVGPKVREWGFFTQRGWQNWKSYFAEKGC